MADAGLSCFLNQGVAAVSIDDITKAAGLSKAAFYRYFENKEGLVALILRPIGESLSSCMNQCSSAIDSAKSIEEVTEATWSGATVAGVLFRSTS